MSATGASGAGAADAVPARPGTLSSPLTSNANAASVRLTEDLPCRSDALARTLGEPDGRRPQVPAERR
ncbi:hypothetical protein Misp01_15190 [Microtetraspora sp. NBRC 13810]|nr:hypothetical protein Misp01_15190 [Microtetraspora sp. NBRC 13810]